MIPVGRIGGIGRGISHKSLRGSLTLAASSTNSSTTDETGHTYAAQAIGTASPNRWVYVAVFTRRSGAISITGVTVGGVVATQVGTQLDANSDANASVIAIALFRAQVPTGTTADIVVTANQTGLRWGIGVFVVDSSHSVLDFQKQAAAAAPQVTVNVARGGLVLCYAANAAASTCAWTNATELTDAQIEAAACHSMAWAGGFESDTTRAITATMSGGTPIDTGLIVVSLAP